MTASSRTSQVLQRALPDDLKAPSLSRDLHRYLVEAAQTPWAWGEHDCCTFAAGWVIERTGYDPMWFIRGGYDSEADARKLIDSMGMEKLWRFGLMGLLLPECDTPKMGDIGLVSVLGEHGPETVGAIFGGKRWAMLSPEGLICIKEKAITQWRVHNG